MRVETFAQAPDAIARSAAVRELRSVKAMLAAARSEYERLEGLFKVWRESKITSKTLEREEVVTLNSLVEAGISIGPSGLLNMERENAGLRKVFDETGLAVCVEPLSGLCEPREWADKVLEPHTLVVRIPRPVRLRVFEKDETGVYTETRSRRHLVVDKACLTEEIRLSEGWFGKRKTGLKFSALGALAARTGSASASAADIADVVGKLPGTITDGLDLSSKFLGQVSALRSGALDAELAELKKRVELRQQEIAMDGLNTTDAAQEELERLKQQYEILKLRKDIAELG